MTLSQAPGKKQLNKQASGRGARAKRPKLQELGVPKPPTQKKKKKIKRHT
jgi:hypothetical protein